MESGGIAPPFFTSELGGGEWLASRPGHLIPRKVSPGTCWMGSIAGLDAVKKTNFFDAARNRTPAV
jgi:hypothetical protein